MNGKRRRRSRTVIAASALAGLGVILSQISFGPHPTKFGTTTTCAALARPAIKQFADAAFGSQQFSSIRDVATEKDVQKAYFAGHGPGPDLAGEITVLVCHGLGQLRQGGTHPIQWELEFDQNHASSLGVEEVNR